MAVVTGVEAVAGRPVSDLVRGDAGGGTSFFGHDTVTTKTVPPTAPAAPTITVTVTPKIVTQTAPPTTVTPAPTTGASPTGSATSSATGTPTATPSSSAAGLP